MKNKLPLNGSDQLMRGFDFEMRRGGFGGNQCQIILGLASPISADRFEKRLATLQNELPMLNARPGGLFKPRWRIPARAGKAIPVRSHRDAPGLREKLFNEPLRLHRGELMRFDMGPSRRGRRRSGLTGWT
jgi:hypothetical protein